MDPKKRVELAKEQLAKVQLAWLDPTDRSDLTVWGMHACENAVVAAAESKGPQVKKTHPDKVAVARKLHEDHGLPDIASLLEELNELRKGFSYGELTAEPTTSAQDIAGNVERYVEAVATFLAVAEEE